MTTDGEQGAYGTEGRTGGGTAAPAELRARFRAEGRPGLVRDRAAEARRTRRLYASLQALFGLVFLFAIGIRLAKGTDPGLWLGAYAVGAAGCALAMRLSLRGRTRLALAVFFVTAAVGGLGDSLVAQS
ncbi:hypothetical protein [Streptomyces sp. NBC_01465]|uniref:hypothetical protein n=1 Tax=Streptomyces sp. NBC_01465 TaxID=2903878 RepID=UPI002E321E2D|nr:hypothetical protein [Streptomyces sp. NBC_01465]